MSLIEILLTGLSTITLGLIKVLWGITNERIREGDKLNAERIVDLDRHHGRHDSKIHDSELRIAETREMINGHYRENDRRFEEIRDVVKDIRQKLDTLIDRRSEDRK